VLCLLFLSSSAGARDLGSQRTGEVVKQIRTGGRPRNTQISRDGRLAFLSPMGGTHEVFVVDIAANHQVSQQIRFGGSLRPSALSADSRFFFQQIDGLNDFQVADLDRNSVVATVEHTTPLSGIYLPFLEHIGRLGTSGLKRCHGLGIRPDQREIWSVRAGHITVHELVPPDFHEVAAIRLPAKGYLRRIPRTPSSPCPRLAVWRRSTLARNES